jgi:hypothetical protein
MRHRPARGRAKLTEGVPVCAIEWSFVVISGSNFLDRCSGHIAGGTARRTG